MQEDSVMMLQPFREDYEGQIHYSDVRNLGPETSPLQVTGESCFQTK